MNAPILRFDRYNRPAEQTPPARPAIWLEITRGRVRHPMRHVNGPIFLIGSAPDCDLVVGDPAFPENYAYLLVHDNEVTIRRVADAPELLINDSAVERATVEDGDRLALGDFEMVLNIKRSIQPAASPSEPPEGSCPWLAVLGEV